MTERDEWEPFSWHCVNCGNIVTGYKNSRGDIKVECKRCKTAMVRTLKKANEDLIRVYAPAGMVHVRRTEC